MNPPPATARLALGSLCLCACVVPLFVADEETGVGLTSEAAAAGSDAEDASSEGPTTPGAPDASLPIATDSDADTTTGVGSTTDTVLDLPIPDIDSQCTASLAACDAEDDELDHALGLNCGGIATLAPLEFAGPAASRAVVGSLGAGPTFAPRFGSRAVLLSTGVAAQIEQTAAQVMMETECSQVGLPCPSTDFDAAFDLPELPAPIEVEGIVCPMGQPPPGPGDCSNTLDEQWVVDSDDEGDDPKRTAHDYTELRFSAAVPEGALQLALDVAFFTAEHPPRFPGGHNDLLLVWLESERWTGNLAVHPGQSAAIAAENLDYLYSGLDPELADFAFAEHGATGWLELAASVTPGDEITVVVALFDGGDGEADSAVLLDNLRWTCSVPQP